MTEEKSIQDIMQDVFKPAPNEEIFIIGEWILGEVEKPPEKIGSIYVPDAKEAAKEEKTKRIKILALGDKLERRDLKVGDIVVVHQSATTLKCEHFGHLFKEGSIMAIIGKRAEDVKEDN